MSANSPLPRIGIFGTDGAEQDERHGCGLWAAGYSSVLTAAGAQPVPLGQTISGRSWDEILEGLDGMVLASSESPSPRHAVQAENLCRGCADQELPLLAIDTGMHILSGTFNGTLFTDLAREFPEALQHRHPPEKGLRHAIAITPGSRLAFIYGDGEVIVNSEHRRAVQRAGKGLAITARALDGVVEGIESEKGNWFGVGVQWHPASSTASGLDIQLFRGLVDASKERLLTKTCCAA
jgi:putative glutamine amidotransferase